MGWHGCGRALRFEIGFVLKFRHGAPVTLRHIGSAAFGIVPLLDGNGVIEPLPQNAVVGLRFVRRGHLEELQGPDDRFPGGVEQRLLMGTVIDEKGFLPVAGTEMAPKDGEDPVLGFNFTA